MFANIPRAANKKYCRLKKIAYGEVFNCIQRKATPEKQVGLGYFFSSAIKKIFFYHFPKVYLYYELTTFISSRAEKM